jgi:hypothetical protein
MDEWMDGGGDGANGTQLPLHNAWPAINLSSQMWHTAQTIAAAVMSIQNS